MEKQNQQNGKAGEIIIAGRTFHGITQELSAAQDHYLIGQLRVAGCLEFIAQSKGTPEENAEGLLTQILISGRASWVLAGCLTEEGKGRWNVQAAEANAHVFDSITDTESKRGMRDALVGFVLGFFQYAIASVATSQKSSSQN